MKRLRFLAANGNKTFKGLYNRKGAMRVTKWGECGILCSMYLALRYGDQPIGAAEIAETQGLDIQYTQ